MNIFSDYLIKILKLIQKASNDNQFKLPEKLSSINVDIPPNKFDGDLSTNVAMVLSKPNNAPPMEIAKTISKLLKENDDNIESIEIIKPGFINIKFNHNFWGEFLNNIINKKNYGSTSGENKKYLIEFVSANPTGPLHVGHCRGAILGDVISNLLIFNNNTVTKEYYVNDHGNQILHFTKSVYFRIREILFKENFPSDNPDLYPGEYLIDIATNILNQKKDIDFENYENIKSELTILSVDESLKLIKQNLKKLGINHDNFASERNLVQEKEVEKVIEKLKSKKFVYTGKIKAPEGEDTKNWVEREQLLFKSTEFGDDKDLSLIHISEPTRP